jgi:N-sulfoglucosamine sulfohydrolase
MVAGAAAVSALSPGEVVAGGGMSSGARPNILWISCEDTSPDLGCYGDPYAITPNLDRLAARGVRYTNAFTHAGVCAPARSGIITGMYPTTIGTHQMRCLGVPPPYVKCFTEYLRAAGYYCTNNVKTDYQFAAPVTAWDENSRRAHWRDRSSGQPFFSVINLGVTHESQIRSNMEGVRAPLASLAPDEKHDPADAVLPPYYPDTLPVRKDWAQYYDTMTLMDRQAGEILDQLEEDGLADDTIVWFWGDHGRGLPRAKRWIYDSGIHVPLIVRVPEKYRRPAMPDNPEAVQPGSVNDTLVSFIDFAPTMLSLAGVKIPEYMQGRAFLGTQRAAPREYVFGIRDRMDGTYDMIRAVRDKRYKYIRNYMPHIIYAQHIDYMEMMPTMQEMRRLHAQGELTGPQTQYFREQKPVEELYDTQTDPHEVKNLADDPQYKDVLERMRAVHEEWMRRTGDVGLIPEPEFDEMKRPGGVWETTAEPAFSVAPGTKDVVTITCATPGASIAYTTEEGKRPPWKLYIEPVKLDRGQVVRAQACRLGFRDSEEVQFKLGDKATGPVEPATGVAHWREQIDTTDLLERLRAIKALDRQGEKAIPAYLDALDDEYASVRYWAVVGVHQAATGAQTVERARPALVKRLGDPSPTVRIAAAEALCGWGLEEQALPVLIEALGHESDTVRLFAANAFGRIGEKARPALPQLKAAMKDKYPEVRNVTKYTLLRLE